MARMTCKCGKLLDNHEAPNDIELHIKTTGLCAYFYNEDFWISLGEINGTLSV